MTTMYSLDFIRCVLIRFYVSSDSYYFNFKIIFICYCYCLLLLLVCMCVCVPLCMWRGQRTSSSPSSMGSRHWAFVTSMFTHEAISLAPYLILTPDLFMPAISLFAPLLVEWSENGFVIVEPQWSSPHPQNTRLLFGVRTPTSSACLTQTIPKHLKTWRGEKWWVTMVLTQWLTKRYRLPLLMKTCSSALELWDLEVTKCSRGLFCLLPWLRWRHGGSPG